MVKLAYPKNDGGREARTVRNSKNRKLYKRFMVQIEIKVKMYHEFKHFMK